MSKSFIIVEDEYIIALQYKMELNRRGHTVLDSCSDAASAYQSLVSHHPDIALVDIYIDGNVDGIELVRRCIKDGMNTQFIFITGNFDTATRERAAALEHSGYFTKPVDMGELLQRISD